MRELGLNSFTRAASIPEGSPGSIPICGLRAKLPLLEKGRVGLFLANRVTNSGRTIKATEKGVGGKGIRRRVAAIQTVQQSRTYFPHTTTSMGQSCHSAGLLKCPQLWKEGLKTITARTCSSL
jgi:hypothetical protein